MPPIQTPTYRDPSHADRVRPSLIGGLMSHATTTLKTPRENQVSEALCWLIDRSAVLAEATLRLFLTEAQATKALSDSKSKIGASTRVSLPALPGDPGRYYFPDIWVAGAYQSFQLMIEVKVDADPHTMRAPMTALAAVFPPGSIPEADMDGYVSFTQQDAYRFAWSLVSRKEDARSRFVGLLSRTGNEETVPQRVPGVASTRNVTWRQLRESFAAARGSAKPEVRIVLCDFLDALDTYVERPGPAVSPDEEKRVVTWGRELLVGARADRSWLPASKAEIKAIHGRHDYVGFHVKFRRDRRLLADIHVFVTHADGRPGLISEPGHAIYLLCNRSRDPVTNSRFLPNWRFGSDRAGYPGWRLVLPLTDIGWTLDTTPSVAEALPFVTTWIRESLEACGLA